MKLIGEAEDEVLVYHVLACLYLVLKVESSLFNVSFEDFWLLCIKLPSYRVMQAHLAPTFTICVWDETLYSKLEVVILSNILNFKTSYVSTAQAVYQTVCTYAGTQECSAQPKPVSANA